MKQGFSSYAALLGACSVYACVQADPVGPAGTDTGNPYGGGNGEGTAGQTCDETPTLLDPGAQTPLGFSAQQVLDFTLGEHTESLAWLQGNVSYGPESGRSELSLRVEALGSPRFIDREPRARQGGSEEGIPLGEIYSPCNDSVQLDVRIQLTTEGGALSELTEATLEATSADFAQGRLSLELDELNGSFTASPATPPNSEVTSTSLTLQLAFSAYGVSGAFAVQSEFRSLDGSAVGQGGSGEIAHFPADDYCGPGAFSVAADETARGLSMAGAIEQLQALSPAALSYEAVAAAGAELSFDVNSPATRTCLRLDDPLLGGDPGAARLTFPAVVSLSSSDGRIQGDVPIEISATSADGASQVLAQATRQADDAALAASLPGELGIQDPIDFSGFDGGRVELSMQVTETTAGGHLRAFGLDVADCVTTPPQPEPGGMSSPGCRGTDRVPVWGAMFGDEVQ